jgi:hypothetical protein
MRRGLGPLWRVHRFNPVVDLVGLASPAAIAPMAAMFRHSFRDAGYVEDQ